MQSPRTHGEPKELHSELIQAGHTPSHPMAKRKNMSIKEQRTIYAADFCEPRDSVAFLSTGTPDKIGKAEVTLSPSTKPSISTMVR